MLVTCFEDTFPNDSYDVAKELLRLLDESDWPPYIVAPYSASLQDHRLRAQPSPDTESFLAGKALKAETPTGRATDRAHIIDEAKVEAYANRQRYQVGDEYDFAAVREFSITMMRSKDAENPVWWEHPQAIKCRIIPSSDGTTRVVLRCEPPGPDDGEEETRVENMHRERAEDIGRELGEALRQALRGTESAQTKQTDENTSSSAAGPSDKIRLRAQVFKRLKDRHPEWGLDTVASEANQELRVENLTASSVRYAYKRMGWVWPRADRIR